MRKLRPYKEAGLSPPSSGSSLLIQSFCAPFFTLYGIVFFFFFLWNFLMKLECRVWNTGCLPGFPRFVPIAPRLALLQELDLSSAPFLLTRTPPRALFIPRRNWKPAGLLKAPSENTSRPPALVSVHPKRRNDPPLPPRIRHGRLAAELCSSPGIM